MNKIFGLAIVIALVMGILSLVAVPQVEGFEVDLEDLQAGIGLLEEITEGSIETVVYKTVESEKLSIDFYEPLNDIYQETPVVVFVHGGSWVAGSKETIANGDRKLLVKGLREAGYAVAAVQYRTLTPTVNFPENIIDIQDSVRFIRSVSEERGYDPDFIGYWGTSAGAHLSMLAGTLEEIEPLGDPTLAAESCQVSYIIDYYGPTTLPTLMGAQTLIVDDMVHSLFGTTGLDDSVTHIVALAEKYSPLNHVASMETPMLIIHGDNDNIVSPDHSLRLVNALDASGKEDLYTYLAIADAGHGILKPTKSKAVDRKRIIDATIDFIDRQR